MRVFNVEVGERPFDVFVPGQSFGGDVAGCTSGLKRGQRHGQYLKQLLVTGVILEPIDLKGNGRGEWIRTTDLLVPNQAL